MNARVVTAVALGSLCLSAQEPDPARVGWQGKSYVLERLPDGVSEQARAAVSAWAPWIAQHDYRMDLDASARVLLVSSHTRARVAGELGLIERTGALFDALLPPPPPSSGAPAPVQGEPKPAPGAAPIPEDPEAPPSGLQPVPAEDPVDQRTAARPATTWGAGSLEPDGQAAVMLVLKTEGDYLSALEFLTGLQPYLAEWIEEARKHTGFAIEVPLCGAYVENASEQEEWNPDNELVHRVMRLFVMRRFGQPPYWLAAGLSWYAELKVMKTIYCFPYRVGFVGVGEHGGWDAWLRSTFGDKKRLPVTMKELTVLSRGSYDDDGARMAWGFVDFVARRHPAAFSSLLEELRLFRHEHDRVELPGGTWRRKRGYEVPVEQQEAILEQQLGQDFLPELTRYWGTMPPPLE